MSERTVVLEDKALRNLEGFVQVPRCILKHMKLSVGAKATYGLLLSYAWEENFCYPAQATLAKDLSVSISQVRRYLKELQQEGYIKAKQRGLTLTNIYYLTSKVTK